MKFRIIEVEKETRKFHEINKNEMFLLSADNGDEKLFLKVDNNNMLGSAINIMDGDHWNIYDFAVVKIVKKVELYV